MTKTFNKGDRVVANKDTKSFFNVGIPKGSAGTVINPEWNGNATHPLIVKFDSVETERQLLINPDDMDLVSSETEDEKVAVALARTKEGLGLCSEFDRAVERAKNLSLEDRLRFVAGEMNREDVYVEFERQLEALDTPPLTVPEIGDYIRATTEDGKTHEFEVTAHKTDHFAIPVTFLQEGVANWKDLFITGPGYSGAPEKSRHIVEWEKIDRPWAVGDVVPAGTVVGRMWLGARVDDPNVVPITFYSDNCSKYDRTIIWIAEA